MTKNTQNFDERLIKLAKNIKKFHKSRQNFCYIVSIREFVGDIFFRNFFKI